jgi:hypothetical protein
MAAVQVIATAAPSAVPQMRVTAVRSAAAAQT